jgi:hypothetical protein
MRLEILADTILQIFQLDSPTRAFDLHGFVFWICHIDKSNIAPTADGTGRLIDILPHLLEGFGGFGFANNGVKNFHF